jgi:hypothetical protein
VIVLWIESLLHLARTSDFETQAIIGWVERDQNCSNMGAPSSKAKYDMISDSEEYREGKIKSKSMTGETEPELAIL